MNKKSGIKLDDFSELFKKIERANKIALFCHINPDPDTFCSAFAFKRALENSGKKVDIFCEDDMIDNLTFLLGKEEVKKESDCEYELAVSIDCSDVLRLGNCQKVFKNAKDNASIDHHKGHKRFSSLLILDDNRSSCSEIIYVFLKIANLLKDDIVQLLFCGMIADNGCFQFSNVTADTHEIAKEMYLYNFDKGDSIYNVFRKKSRNVFNLTNRVLAKCKFYDDDQIAIVRIMRDDFMATNTTTQDTSGIITQAINVKNVEIAFAVSETDDYRFKISIRTKKYIDANECAAVYGGGGHIRAAGLRLNGHIEDICDKLLKIARDRLK